MKTDAKPATATTKSTVRKTFKAPGAAALRDLLSSFDDLDSNADTAADLAPFLRFAADLA